MGIKSLSEPLQVSPDLSSKMANVSFVSALLIVLIHCYQSSTPGTYFWWFTELIGGGKWLTGGFVRCAVPWFFIASGFFLAGHFDDTGWWKRAVRTRVRSLMLPYIIWSAVACLPFAIVMIVRGHACPTLGWWLHGFGIEIQGNPFLKQLWFLKALFIWVLLAPFLRRLANIPGLIALFLLYGIQATQILPINWKWYSFFGNTMSLEGAFYISLGYYLRWHAIEMPRWLKCAWLIGFVSFAILVTYALADLNGYARCALLLKWAAIPSSLMFLWLIVTEKKLPSTFVSMAFPIYLSHMLFSMHLRRYFAIAGFDDDSIVMFACLILIYMFSLGGAMLTTFVLRKFTPTVARIAFGGR